jgi:hypothetical protein
VIDDVSHSADWGSINSRAYGALACGALFITNGRLGSGEILDQEIPIYSGAAGLLLPVSVLLPIHSLSQDLTRQLLYYLIHETERIQLVQSLQSKAL